ncbi:hypothetical protein DPMN_038483 [Dreissena polymorpha]|uniref:Uncharacterized protein n=1 Tax=Dreissena polymorpha TaxID=45954 RepID=A0A9D4RQQ7_DREPO|nr:hypothetical protein DPMN_038483 [Dreissena polymorpha]
MDDKWVDEYRYPRAGKTNADSCLKMAQFTVGNDGRPLSSLSGGMDTRRKLCPLSDVESGPDQSHPVPDPSRVFCRRGPVPA